MLPIFGSIFENKEQQIASGRKRNCSNIT